MNYPKQKNNRPTASTTVNVAPFSGHVPNVQTLDSFEEALLFDANNTFVPGTVSYKENAMYAPVHSLETNFRNHVPNIFTKQKPNMASEDYDSIKIVNEGEIEKYIQTDEDSNR